MKHIHAELMLQYAQDAMETDKPWERWEYSSPIRGKWVSVESHPIWFINLQYRRKKETIVINGIEVQKPFNKRPKKGTEYYIPDIVMSNLRLALTWNNGADDYRHLKRGLIHLDEESAITYAKALLSFTTKDTDEK